MLADGHVLEFFCEDCEYLYRVAGVDISCPRCGELPSDDRDGRELQTMHRFRSLCVFAGAMAIPVDGEEDEEQADDVSETGWERWKRYGESWPEARRQALERDDHECQHCGITHEEHKQRDDLFPPGKGLHVHHIVPLREFESTEEANQLDNLICLCGLCHAKVE